LQILKREAYASRQLFEPGVGGVCRELS
jgi:hypothetical protein